MISQRQDGHWLIVSIGTIARTIEASMSFVCAYAFVNAWAQTHQGNPYIAALAMIVLTFIFNVVLVFIHEMGHALAAWSVRRRVHLICVGTIGFRPRTKKLEWVKQPDAAEYAGFVSSSPIWPDTNRAKSIWVSFGGPFATLLTGLLLLTYARHSALPNYPILLLSAFFLLDAFINLLPMRWSQSSSSDGLHILQYLSGNFWTPESWAETRLGTEGPLVSDAEWAQLRAHVKQPFYGGPNFRKLLRHAAAEQKDEEMLFALRKAAKLTQDEKP